MSQKLNAAIAVIGIDIGKNSFHIVGHTNRICEERANQADARPCIPHRPRQSHPLQLLSMSGCCARATSGQAAAAPPKRLMNSRRRI
jgi:hypothetical protein